MEKPAKKLALITLTQNGKGSIVSMENLGILASKRMLEARDNQRAATLKHPPITESYTATGALIPG